MEESEAIERLKIAIKRLKEEVAILSPSFKVKCPAEDVTLAELGILDGHPSYSNQNAAIPPKEDFDFVIQLMEDSDLSSIHRKSIDEIFHIFECLRHKKPFAFPKG